MERQDNSAFFTGLAIGLGAGVVLGMILAPASGRETRAVVRKSASEGEQYVEERGAEIRDSLKLFIRAVSRQRDNLTTAIETGKEAYRKATGRSAPEPSAPPAGGAPAES